MLSPQPLTSPLSILHPSTSTTTFDDALLHFFDGCLSSIGVDQNPFSSLPRSFSVSPFFHFDLLPPTPPTSPSPHTNTPLDTIPTTPVSPGSTRRRHFLLHRYCHRFVRRFAKYETLRNPVFTSTDFTKEHGITRGLQFRISKLEVFANKCVLMEKQAQQALSTNPPLLSWNWGNSGRLFSWSSSTNIWGRPKEFLNIFAFKIFVWKQKATEESKRVLFHTVSFQKGQRLLIEKSEALYYQNEVFTNPNNFDEVASHYLKCYRMDQVVIFRQKQESKSGSKRMRKSKLNKRIQKIKDGTNAQTEKLVQKKMDTFFQVYKKEVQARYGGSESSIKNEKKFGKYRAFQSVKLREYIHNGQAPLKRCLMGRAQYIKRLDAGPIAYWDDLTQLSQTKKRKENERKRMVRGLVTSNSFHQMESTLESSDPTIISTTQNKKPACRSTTNSFVVTNYPRSPSRHDTTLVEKKKDGEVQCEEKIERRDRIETKESSNENSLDDEETEEFVEPFYIGYQGIRYSNDVDGRQQEQDDRREDDMDMGIGDYAWCAEENRCGDFYDFY